MSKVSKPPPPPRDQSMYRNSIAPCNTYSNPYDTRMAVHPALTQRRAEEYARSQDVMVSARKKMEMDLLQKFLKFPEGKFVLIGMVGKFAFLAIVLPPYIFLYGMPKWLLTEGIPLVFNKLMNVRKKLAQAIWKPLRRAIQKIINPFQVLMTALRNKVESVRQYLKAMYQKVYAFITYPWKVFQNSLVKPFVERYRAFREILNKFGAQSAKLIKSVQEQIVKSRKTLEDLIKSIKIQAASMRNIAGKFFEKLLDRKNSFQFIHSWAAPSLNSIKQFSKKMMEGLEKIYERIIKKPSKKINSLLLSARESAKKKYNQISERMTKLIEPMMNFLMQPFLNRTSWENISKKFKKEGLIEGCKQIGKECLLTGKKALQFCSNFISGFIAGFAKLIPFPVGKFLSFIGKAAKNLAKTRSKIADLKSRMVKKLNQIKEKVLSGFNWLQGRMKHLLTLSSQAYHKVKSIAVSYAARSVSFIGWLFSVCREAFKRVSYILILIMAWISILLKQGMHSVRVTAHRLLNRT